MTPEQSVIAAIVLCMLGAVLTLLVSRSKTVAGWLAFAFTLATAVMMVSAVVHVLTSGPGHQQEFPIVPQVGLVLRVYVDGLTAVFLLLAARNPAANRSLILCVAWANLAHAAVMMIQGIRHPGEAPSGPVGLAIMASISVALIVLAPAQPTSRPAAAEASVPAVSRN